MKSFLLLLSGFLIFLFVLTGTSCQKETDCKASINCYDSLGNAFPNVSILLYAPVKDPSDPKGILTTTADVKANGVTDGGGQVNFTFKLPAIYNINASILLGSTTYTGTSIIKLEEGKTASAKVTVK